MNQKPNKLLNVESFQMMLLLS